MSNLRQAAQQALEALEWNYNTDLDNIPACEQWAKMLNENITALRAALAEPECKCTMRQKLVGDGCAVCNPERAKDLAEPERKPLTDEEISAILDDTLEGGSFFDVALAVARAIERAHGITGETNV